VTIRGVDAFERAFPRRELFRGRSRSVFIFSSLGSLTLCLLLVDLVLVADLLGSGGRVSLNQAEAVEAGRLIGTENARSEVPAGLLPVVWWSREKFWGLALSTTYRHVDWLKKNGTALMTLLAAAAVLVLLRNLLVSRARRAATRVGLDVVMRLGRSLHRQRLRLGPGDLQDADGRYVLGLFTGDVQLIRDGVSLWLSRVGRYPLEFVLLVALAICLNWLVALQCLIPLAACWFLVRQESRRFQSTLQLAESRADVELRLLAESFRKTRLVRGYGMESFERDQFQRHLERFRDDVTSAKRDGRWARLMLMILCLAIVLFLVGSRVLGAPQEFSFSAALLSLMTLASLHWPLTAFWDLRQDRAQASLAAGRVYRYLDRVPEVGQAVGAKFLQPLSKALQFEGVSYRLANGNTLLDRLDVKLPAGETMAVVSLNPLESLVMAYLLPRFIEPHAGRVLFDGEDIAWTTLESLRLEAVFVGGSDPFFTETVMENISCGQSDYSLQQITEAAKQTHAHKFILKLPQGYETVLGEHGEQLDAGQGFRLGLARALLRNPALMIIAEPTEPIDDDTKSLLDDTYNRICRERTVLFLPTRLPTLRRASQIVLLHRGKVESIGTHAELVKLSPLYRHWEYMHFNEFRNNGE